MTGVGQRCQQVLEGSWTVGDRDGVPFAYTRPSPGRYRWQWYWDSCFAAISWRHFDPARSRAELETLLAAARPDGFIGHTIFWEHPVTGPRELFYNVIHRDDFMTATIQPPALAFAWRVAVGDPALEPRIVAHHAAISAARDLEGDGLLWILQPDESGLDASPQFDPIWGDRAQGLPGFARLVRRNRQREFRVEAVRAEGDPLVCEVLTNVIHGLSRLALGLPSITSALIARCYDQGPLSSGPWPTSDRRPGALVRLPRHPRRSRAGLPHRHHGLHHRRARSVDSPPRRRGSDRRHDGHVHTLWRGAQRRLAAVLLYQAIGLLVPLIGGAIAYTYTVLRRRFGPIRPRATADPVTSQASADPGEPPRP